MLQFSCDVEMWHKLPLSLFYWPVACYCCTLLLADTFRDYVYSTAKEKEAPKVLVTGRPILLALEDVDGTPSFLEKALRFLEEHGEVFFLLIFTLNIPGLLLTIYVYDVPSSTFSSNFTCFMYYLHPEFPHLIGKTKRKKNDNKVK